MCYVLSIAIWNVTWYVTQVSFASFWTLCKWNNVICSIVSLVSDFFCLALFLRDILIYNIAVICSFSVLNCIQYTDCILYDHTWSFKPVSCGWYLGRVHFFFFLLLQRVLLWTYYCVSFGRYMSTSLLARGSNEEWNCWVFGYVEIQR